MERTAQNRVIFEAGEKKEKSRNPHGYWIFRWRSGWDSNPRAREDYLISSQARYDHFDTLPNVLTSGSTANAVCSFIGHMLTIRIIQMLSKC